MAVARWNKIGDFSIISTEKSTSITRSVEFTNPNSNAEITNIKLHGYSNYDKKCIVILFNNTTTLRNFKEQFIKGSEPLREDIKNNLQLHFFTEDNLQTLYLLSFMNKFSMIDTETQNEILLILNLQPIHVVNDIIKNEKSNVAHDVTSFLLTCMERDNLILKNQIMLMGIDIDSLKNQNIRLEHGLDSLKNKNLELERRLDTMTAKADSKYQPSHFLRKSY